MAGTRRQTLKQTSQQLVKIRALAPVPELRSIIVQILVTPVPGPKEILIIALNRADLIYTVKSITTLDKRVGEDLVEILDLRVDVGGCVAGFVQGGR
ncbi:hypothetical protein FOXG_18371 [Fusarium oxysporum f. sp. lycopersici 4287]|uniref:Uncharacterized protein n=2 Tax=Fusarium oxysporum TaxID=5507 RepID=A0A0J9UJD6_FUSO4|nr:hypothetical protein FOXG_18371 [Fusarium oxysporum f. sp. lycopersici 4287]EXK27414.1 hypothetical protein FOMG_16220 [Fusarium oxysporum f. sp. melonis 26406]KNA98255.1 hypothetical protein FOXG_18371 [Fusarium oxysporum f. sp. lycopersici 4287]